MNNKGFGVIELFLFSAFTIFMIFTAYSYFPKLMGDLFYSKPSSYNYVNPYTKYYKDGTISKVDNKIMRRSNNNIVSDSYSALENELGIATMKYFEENYSNLKDEMLFIKSSTLKKDGYIGELIYSKDNSICEGYTVIHNNSYKSYIKCPGYTTSGYDY